jgi:hypothetical protein
MDFDRLVVEFGRRKISENPDFPISSALLLAEFVEYLKEAAQQSVHGDSALPPGHSGSSLECMHPFCVAERETPSA